MSIFNVDPLELQNTNAKNIKLITNINVINIVYCDLQIKISSIWICEIAFSTNNNKNIIGENATIVIDIENNKKLEINGIITEQETILPIETNNINIILLTVKMPLFLSSGNCNNRIFTEQNLEEIISTVLSSNYMKLNIVLNSNTKITMCQFNETDLDFFHKICNHIGIFYFHNFNNNTLVISDDINMFDRKNFIDSYYITQKYSYKLVFSNTTVYTTPENTTQVSKTMFATNSKYSIDNVREIYTQRFCTQNHIRQIAQNLQNSQNKNYCSKYRVGTVEFWPGTFLKDLSELVYKLVFNCFPYKTQNYCLIYCYNNKTFLLPEKNNNVQQKIFTGIVDNKNNTADIDENYYVHVKLHFNQQNPNNFIKARVSQINAGNEYGSWNIPKGGQEVIVMFMDEILSYAIVLGSLYSNDILPHYKDKNVVNQFYLRNETTGQDGKKNKDKFYANEIFMDNTKDKEILRIGARLNCEFLVTQHINIIINENTDINLKNTRIQLNTLKIKEKEKTFIESNETEIKVNKQYCLSADNINIKAKQNINIDSNNIEINANKQIIIKSPLIKIETNQIIIDAKTLYQIKTGSSKIILTPATLNLESSISNIKLQSAIVKIETILLKSNSLLINSQSCLIQSSSTVIIGITAFL